MIETQKLAPQKKKSKLVIKKKSDEYKSIIKYGCLFKQNLAQTDQSSTQSQEQDPLKVFIQDIFCYRTIKSIVKSQHFINLKLKESQTDRQSMSGHIMRFKKSQLKSNQNIGSYLEILDQQMKEKSLTFEKKNICEKKELFQKQLQKVLEQKKDTRCLIFYYEPSQKLLNYSQLLISTKLLQDLGYDVNEFCDNFLKYKHLFFEIFETTLFEKGISILAQNFHQFAEQNSKKQSLNVKEICGLMEQNMKKGFKFSDFVYKRINDPSGRIEQKLTANFNYYKVQANITIVQLQSLDQQNIIECHKKKMSHAQKKVRECEEVKISKEKQEMRKLMHKGFSSEQESSVKEVSI